MPDGVVGRVGVVTNHFQRMDNRRFSAVIGADQHGQSLGRFNDRADVGHVVFEHDFANHLILNSALRDRRGSARAISPWRWGHAISLVMNAIKKRLGRLKLPSFKLRQFGFGGNQFAAKGFGERGLNQFVGAGGGGVDAGLDLVRQREQCFDPADDFVLFGERWKGQPKIRTSSLLMLLTPLVDRAGICNLISAGLP